MAQLSAGSADLTTLAPTSLTLPTTTPLSAPGALTATATGDAGNPNGTYTYKVTLVTAFGETTGGPTSNSVAPASKTVSLTAIPTGAAGTTARKIYRIKNGGSVYYLLTTIGDNVTTTYTDNTADASLGTALVPTLNDAYVGLVAGKTYYDTTNVQHIVAASSSTYGRSLRADQPLFLDTGKQGGLYTPDGSAFTLFAGDYPDENGDVSVVEVYVAAAQLYSQDVDAEHNTSVQVNPLFTRVVFAGTGTYWAVQNSSTVRLKIDTTGIGFFAVTPVAQQTNIVNADGTLADITTKFNSLLEKLEAYGLLAA